jgi:hypothetical protein
VGVSSLLVPVFVTPYVLFYFVVVVLTSSLVIISTEHLIISVFHSRGNFVMKNFLL